MEKSKPARQRIAITGGDGFIGSELMRQARARGHVVEAVCREAEVDIRNAADVYTALEAAKPDVVIHLAAVSGPMVLAEHPDVVTSVNTVGTINVLEAARRIGNCRVILASSVAGYSSGTEECPLPASVYGVTKRFAELAGQHYCGEFGLSVTSVRIGSVYGPERQTDHVLHRMIHSAISRGEVSYESTGWEPLVHVTDCGRLLAALADVQSWRPTYNAVTTPVSHRFLAEEVVRCLTDRNVSLRELGNGAERWPLRFDSAGLLADTGLMPEMAAEAGIRDLVRARVAA